MLDTLTKIFDILLNEGVMGAVLVLFVILWIRANAAITTMAKSFNKQIASLNEKRGEEIRLVTKALQANADNNEQLSHALEGLKNWCVNHKLCLQDFDEQNLKEDLNERDGCE